MELETIAEPDDLDVLDILNLIFDDEPMMAHVLVFKLLRDHGNEYTKDEIASHIPRSRRQIRRVLNDLESRGLVSRVIPDEIYRKPHRWKAVPVTEYGAEEHQPKERFDYGPGWDSKKKNAVRRRDGYECQGCGMSNERHESMFNEVLHVHHVVKARSFDDPHKRNAMENLVTLCHFCHTKWENIGLRPSVIGG